MKKTGRSTANAYHLVPNTLFDMGMTATVAAVAVSHTPLTQFTIVSFERAFSSWACLAFADVLIRSVRLGSLFLISLLSSFAQSEGRDAIAQNAPK